MKQIPSKSLSKSEIFEQLDALRQEDIDGHGGRSFGGVYHPGKEAEEVGRQAYMAFLDVNALYPNQFPSVLQLENQLVAMGCAHVSGGSEAVGNFTSGGTESIMLAVKTARDQARALKPQITEPEMILPTTAHAAHQKAAHYLAIKAVLVPVDPTTFKADINAMAAAITPNTIMLAGSAPSYAHGVIDDIEALGKLALEHDLFLHVDGCMGALLLPYFRRLGEDIPPFDFSVAGVSSISIDLHKYGFCPKSASLILYRNKSIRRHQLYTCSSWPGYLQINTTVQSSKSGGPLAAAWAVMHHIGDQGYLELARVMRDCIRRLIDGVREIPELHIIGEPQMTLFAVSSDEVDIFEVNDELTIRGWYVQPQLAYGSSKKNIHLSIQPSNAHVVDEFLSDLRAAVEVAKTRPRFDTQAALQKAMESGGGMDAFMGAMGISDLAIPQRMTPINHILSDLPSQMADPILADFINELYIYRD